MGAKTEAERLNEKADEVLDMLERMIEDTTCDQFQCGNPAVWGMVSTDDNDYPACMMTNECTRCEAIKLIKWIKHESG